RAGARADPPVPRAGGWVAAAVPAVRSATAAPARVGDGPRRVAASCCTRQAPGAERRAGADPPRLPPGKRALARSPGPRRGRLGERRRRLTVGGRRALPHEPRRAV